MLQCYVDASFAVHPNMRGCTGGELTLETGCHLDRSAKHWLNNCSSTISEIVVVDDNQDSILLCCQLH